MILQNNKDEVLINVKNGILAVTENGKKLKKSNPELFFLYKLPIEYKREANAPVFQEYLDKVISDIKEQQALAEFFGYIFINNTNLIPKKALVLYRSTWSGKFIFFTIINWLLGHENVCLHSLQELTDQKGHYRYDLLDKLLNCSLDLSDKINTNVFKKLVDGDPVQARDISGNSFMMIPCARLMIITDELPKKNQSPLRRFLIIRFTEWIPTNVQDFELEDKIIDSELPGIFNWYCVVYNGC